MSCSPSWEDAGGPWNLYPPSGFGSFYRTWEWGACNVGIAQEVMTIRDETWGAGFDYVGIVEEFSGFTDSSYPWLNNWDTCAATLTEENPGDVWIEDEPISGTPGDCNE